MRCSSHGFVHHKQPDQFKNVDQRTTTKVLLIECDMGGHMPVHYVANQLLGLDLTAATEGGKPLISHVLCV